MNAAAPEQGGKHDDGEYGHDGEQHPREIVFRPAREPDGDDRSDDLQNDRDDQQNLFNHVALSVFVFGLRVKVQNFQKQKLFWKLTKYCRYLIKKRNPTGSVLFLLHTGSMTYFAVNTLFFSLMRAFLPVRPRR